MPASVFSFLPSCCHFLPIAVQVHLGITPEGQDQAQGAAVGTDGTGESLSLSTLQPWPNPSLPAPTFCRGSPPQEGWSPPHSDPGLWILPAGSEVVGVGLPPAGLPRKRRRPESQGLLDLLLPFHMVTSCTLPAPVPPIPRQKISGYLRI